MYSSVRQLYCNICISGRDVVDRKRCNMDKGAGCTGERERITGLYKLDGQLVTGLGGPPIGGL